MTVSVWSNVRVAAQSVIGSPLTITAITLANPAVASSTAHGLSNGDIIKLDVVGMTQLRNRIVRVAGVTTDTFQLEGIDSTGFDAFISGTAREVTLGAVAATFQDVNASGGEVQPIDISTIHEDEDRELPGNRSALVYEFGSLWDPADPCLLELRAASDTKTTRAVEVRFANGRRVFFDCYPAASLAPTGSRGGPATTPVSFRLAGLVTFYAN